MRSVCTMFLSCGSLRKSHLCLAPQIDPEHTQLLQQHATCPAAKIALVLDQGQAYFGPRVLDVAAYQQSTGTASYSYHMI